MPSCKTYQFAKYYLSLDMCCQHFLQISHFLLSEAFIVLKSFLVEKSEWWKKKQESCILQKMLCCNCRQVDSNKHVYWLTTCECTCMCVNRYTASALCCIHRISMSRGHLLQVHLASMTSMMSMHRAINR